MPRILSILFLWLATTQAALAQCVGTDLRESLTAVEKAELATRMEQAIFAEGNHWRAVKGDEIIHLIGTVHVDDPKLADITRRLGPIVETSGALLLEMTQVEEDALTKALGTRPEFVLLQDTTLPELLDEDVWQRLSAALKDRGMPPFMAAKFRPWYISTLLAMPTCLSDAIKDLNGLDAKLEAIADAQGIPTRALEPFDTGFTVFDAIPMDLQLAMIEAALNEPSANQNLLATLMAGYFDETHLEGWELSDILSARYSGLSIDETRALYDVMSDALLTKRNQAWIPVILDAATRFDGPITVAFGAAHLGGETGVLALLEAQGFTLTRQPF